MKKSESFMYITDWIVKPPFSKGIETIKYNLKDEVRELLVDLKAKKLLKNIIFNLV